MNPNSNLYLIQNLFKLTAIIYIIMVLFSTDNGKSEKFICFLTMIMSAICCSGAVMESVIMLQIVSMIFGKTNLFIN